MRFDDLYYLKSYSSNCSLLKIYLRVGKGNSLLKYSCLLHVIVFPHTTLRSFHLVEKTLNILMEI